MKNFFDIKSGVMMMAMSFALLSFVFLTPSSGEFSFVASDAEAAVETIAGGWGTYCVINESGPKAPNCHVGSKGTTVGQPFQCENEDGTWKLCQRLTVTKPK